MKKFLSIMTCALSILLPVNTSVATFLDITYNEDQVIYTDVEPQVIDCYLVLFRELACDVTNEAYALACFDEAINELDIENAEKVFYFEITRYGLEGIRTDFPRDEVRAKKIKFFFWALGKGRIAMDCVSRVALDLHDISEDLFLASEDQYISELKALL